MLEDPNLESFPIPPLEVRFCERFALLTCRYVKDSFVRRCFPTARVWPLGYGKETPVQEIEIILRSATGPAVIVSEDRTIRKNYPGVDAHGLSPQSTRYLREVNKYLYQSPFKASVVNEDVNSWDDSEYAMQKAQEARDEAEKKGRV